MNKMAAIAKKALVFNTETNDVTGASWSVLMIEYPTVCRKG